MYWEEITVWNIVQLCSLEKTTNLNCLLAKIDCIKLEVQCWCANFKKKQHKGGENAQPLFNHWVNFSSLQSWLVGFLQNRWRLLLKQFICWIFTLDCLCAWLRCGLFQGCGAVIKMTQLWLWSQWRSQLKNLGQNVWFSENNTILFGKTPLKAQNDYIF